MVGEIGVPQNMRWKWITPTVVISFLTEIGVGVHCRQCLNQSLFIDTGSDDGYVPRSSTYTTSPEGYVNMGESRHIPCARTICTRCGHTNIYSMYALETWQQNKLEQPNG